MSWQLYSWICLTPNQYQTCLSCKSWPFGVCTFKPDKKSHLTIPASCLALSTVSQPCSSLPGNCCCSYLCSAEQTRVLTLWLLTSLWQDGDSLDCNSLLLEAHLRFRDVVDFEINEFFMLPLRDDNMGRPGCLLHVNALSNQFQAEVGEADGAPSFSISC